MQRTWSWRRGSELRSPRETALSLPPPARSAFHCSPLRHRPEQSVDKLKRVAGLRPPPPRHLVAEPGELALGVAAGIRLTDRDGVLEGHLAAQVRDQRRDAVGAYGRQHRVEPA